MTKKNQRVKRLTAQMRGRLGIVFVLIVCLFLVLIVRLAYWNIYKGDEFSTRVLDNQESSSTTIAFERGKIYDRNGNILATNEKKYTLILEPKNILSSDRKYYDYTVKALHKYLNLNTDDLRDYIEEHESSYYEVYKKDLTYEQVNKLQDVLSLKTKSITDDMTEKEKKAIANARQIKGVVFEEAYKRIYPQDSLACRVLGFVLPGSVGTWGIEQYYDSELNGVDGRTYAYLNQELVTEKTVKEPENGNSVVSTIDMEIQRAVEEEIQIYDNAIGSKNTSVLVMDPNNGEILAMASSNSYNLNDPMNEEELEKIYTAQELAEIKAYTKQKEEEEKQEKEGKKTEKKTTTTTKKNQKTIYDAFAALERNSIVSDAYEPGSTYKPFTVAAGLESGTLKGDENYYCTGSLRVADRNIGCSHVHGDLSLEKSVAYSCNVSMMNIAFKEGADAFYDYQKMFGFGQKTGVDLPGEANTSKLVYNASNFDNDATLATNSFGQNFNCTMIQMASGFASLINGGYYYKPHVVKEILSPDGNVIKEVDKDVIRYTISEETSDKLKSFMKSTIDGGTGVTARIPGYSIGGKTGTAEKIPRNKEDYYVSLIAFVPIDNPEVLIYVTIDEPNLKEQASANIACELERRCMQRVLTIKDIKPEDQEKYDGAVAYGDYDPDPKGYKKFERYEPPKDTVARVKAKAAQRAAAPAEGDSENPSGQTTEVTTGETAESTTEAQTTTESQTTTETQTTTEAAQTTTESTTESSTEQ